MYDKCFRRKIRHAMASRYAYLQVDGSSASLRRFRDSSETNWSRFESFQGDLRRFAASLRRIEDIWYNLSRLAMNSDRFAMNSGSSRAWTTIVWRFELIGGENLKIWDHCGSICVDWNRFGWVGNEFGDSKENTIHYGIAFLTKSKILGTNSDWKRVWRWIRTTCGNCDDIWGICWSSVTIIYDHYRFAI